MGEEVLIHEAVVGLGMIARQTNIFILKESARLAY